MTVATTTLHEMAQGIFRQSLTDCSIEQAFTRKIKVATETGGRKLLVNGVEVVDLDRMKHIRIVATGKAATAMLEAVLPHLSSPQCDVAGVLIARELPLSLPPNFQFFLGGHPLPNEASCAGAQAALEMLQAAREDKANAGETLCLFLISGGASAMMELPLDPAISLTDMVDFHRELVHCGASIAEINCVRKHFSAVKGGRLALAAGGVTSLSLLVSDVPPGHLDTLASGPTLPDASTVHQCREVLARYSLLERFPLSVRQYFSRHDLPETPKAEELTAKSVTLLASDDLAESARMRAEELGFYAVIDNTCDDWDYRAAAEYLVNRLRGLRDQYSRVCLISSGEVTVKLPSMNADEGEARKRASGAGGRNQHFGLYAATLLDSSDASTVVLSAGSDGIDGNSPAAGTVVDEQTLLQQNSRLRADAEKVLEDFDSYTFLEGIGATIVTGATGNNLRDLRILLAERSAK